MSMLPPPPPPPVPGAPPAPDPGRGKPRGGIALVGGIVVAIVVAAGLVFVVAGRDSGEPAEEAEEEADEEEAPEPPAEWDPRLLELVEFVEDERALAFKHPVTVEYLDEAAWKEQADIDEEEILDEDAQLLEHGAGLFRAVGLAEGEIDLVSDTETLGASATVGHYDFEDETIRIRGTELTPKIKAVMVHELTHVLQDQHFDLGDRMEKVAEEDTDEESLRVLVEGDADRIEDIWVESLSSEEREALAAQQREEGNSATEALDELPQSLVTFFASSYILGAGFIDILEADGGTAAIDDAFEAPPGPDEHVADPIAYIEGDEESEVEPPKVDGEPIEDVDGDFGAVSWYLMLAERTDPKAALAAIDGWGGDHFVAFTDGDRTCAALRFVGEDQAAGAAMGAALEDWAAAMPAAASVEVKVDDDVVDLVTCDPGEDADLLEDNGRSPDTISLFATRSQFATDVLQQGATRQQARCFSRRLIASIDYELLIKDALSDEERAQVQQLAGQQVAACR